MVRVDRDRDSGGVKWRGVVFLMKWNYKSQYDGGIVVGGG